jgi:large subunit ribosomal protein L5
MDTWTTKIEKTVVNAGIGKIASQPNFSEKILPEIIKDFALITGQKPMTRPARKSIAGFKLREGMVVGLTATLRGRRMAEFLSHLTKVVLPRIRDFRGVSFSAVDKQGNLSIGIREAGTFPEVNSDVVKANFGFQVTVVPRRFRNREEAITLYRTIGIPFEKK